MRKVEERWLILSRRHCLHYWNKFVMNCLLLHIGRKCRVTSIHNVPGTVIYPFYTNSDELISVCLKLTRRLHHLIKDITLAKI